MTPDCQIPDNPNCEINFAEVGFSESKLLRDNVLSQGTALAVPADWGQTRALAPGRDRAFEERCE